ncbi:MAG: hypothetical protein JXR91_04345 [Deltaproteobacteria bacterium]|nr:hypothetical protein [Deltaproteobacteria bacterium]
MTEKIAILNQTDSMPSTKEGAQQFLRKLKDSDFPDAMVKQMSPQDILFAMDQADEEQLTDLLLLVSKEQFDSIIDLSCWDGYTPSIEKVETLIAPLVATGLEGAMQALDKLENELKTLILKNHITVYLREDKDDDEPWVPDTSDFITTPDGFYFIEIPFADDQTDVVKQLIQALLFKPFEEYHAEFQCVLHDLPSELEESALRWREGRLGDLGFGTIEEGMALLSPIDPVTLQTELDKKIKESKIPHPLVTVGTLPAVYAENFKGIDLLDQSLEILLKSNGKDVIARMEYLPAEITAMTNLFLTGIRCKMSSIDDVTKGTKLARNTLALGLNAIAGNSPRIGAKALTHLVPGQLIHGAMGLLMPLKKRAETLLKSPSFEKGSRLDEYYQAALKCLNSTVPGWWHKLEDESVLDGSFISPLDEEIEGISNIETVKVIDNILLEIESLEDIFTEKLNFDLENYLKIEETLTVSSIIYNYLANAYLTGEPLFEPLDKEDAENFAESFCDEKPDNALLQAINVLAPITGISKEGTIDPFTEEDPAKRALLKVLKTGLELLNVDPLSFSILK